MVKWLLVPAWRLAGRLHSIDMPHQEMRSASAVMRSVIATPHWRDRYPVCGDFRPANQGVIVSEALELATP